MNVQTHLIDCLFCCRLSAALKMLPQLVAGPSSPSLQSPAVGESLAALLRALASSVWRGTTLTQGYPLEIEQIFK